jgi:DNA-binding CsgD family transcriptional regulator
MSVLHIPPRSLSSLSDKEREILSLLTAGHTVKSIALELGRSETSINERLRDARRKTGVGSSRELARLLDDQKNWDKKIDLSGSGNPTHDAARPRSAGRFRSKGTMIMLIALPLATAGLIFAANPLDRDASTQAAHATAFAPSPLTGRWSLDVARIPADERPRQVTIVFHHSADQKWTTQVTIISPDGGNMQAESTAAVDGVAVPITGTMPFIDTVSLRQPAPNTLVMTLAKDGAPVSTRVYAVAADLKTMTETIVWAGSAVPKLETNHFTRMD